MPNGTFVYCSRNAGINDSGLAVSFSDCGLGSNGAITGFSNGELIDIVISGITEIDGTLLSSVLALDINLTKSGSFSFIASSDGGRDWGTAVIRADLILPIPEPTTLALFGVGLLGLGVAARRRRRKNQREQP